MQVVRITRQESPSFASVSQCHQRAASAVRATPRRPERTVLTRRTTRRSPVVSQLGWAGTTSNDCGSTAKVRAMSKRAPSRTCRWSGTKRWTIGNSRIVTSTASGPTAQETLYMGRSPWAIRRRSASMAVCSRAREPLTPMEASLDAGRAGVLSGVAVTERRCWVGCANVTRRAASVDWRRLCAIGTRAVPVPTGMPVRP